MDDDFAAPVALPPSTTPQKSSKRKKFDNESVTCFVLSCDEPKKSGKRWCTAHNTNFDNMYYQARNAKTVPLLEGILSDPTTATEAMEEWDRDNPPH